MKKWGFFDKINDSLDCQYCVKAPSKSPSSPKYAAIPHDETSRHERLSSFIN